MKTMLLAAGVAATVLSAGSALAATRHHAMGGAVAPPKQPIPYAQLDSYLKASPAQRARKDWWSGQMAATGAQANTSASSSMGGAGSPTMSNDTPTGASASSGMNGAPSTANGMPVATGSAAGAADATAAPAESNMPGPDNLRDKNAATPSTSTDRPH